MALWGGIIVLAVFLQSVLIAPVPLISSVPDIVLIAVMYAAFSKGAKKGALAGFAGGMAEDFFSGGLLGVNSLVKLVIGYVLGSMRKKFEYGSKGFQFISVFVVSCASQAFAYSVMQLGGQRISPVLLGEVFFKAAFLNAALAPLIFRLLSGIEKYDRSKSD